MKLPRSGGGWAAIRYSLRKAREAGGLLRFYRALRTRNACKTCALGMGGQRGGMVNEAGHFPEICKKSMQAMVADMQGRIAPEFWSRYDAAALRTLSPRELESLGRLNDPVFADGPDADFRPVSWEQALQFCADRLRETAPDENFFYFSGRSSNEAAFLLQLFARVYGTNNISNCSYYCHQASGVGLQSVIGTGTATVALEDLDRCDFLMLIGGNPASNHPRLMRTLVELRRRGGEVVVVNPLREVGLVNFRVPSDLRSLLFGSPIASLYVQPLVGGDAALLAGIGKSILESGAEDRGFINRHTEGFDAYAAFLREAGWQQLESAAGVSQSQMRDIAARYARSRAAVFAWTMGITHHRFGVENVRAIAALALLRGMVGRPGAGLMPIRGHSNVQGIGSVGVTPQLKDAVFAALEQRFDVKLPRTPGLDTLASLRAAHEGRLRNGWCLGGNLFGASPDARFARDAIGRLDSIVYISTTMNTGHVQGRAGRTLILPTCARDEEAQPTTQESMFSLVRVSDGGPPRLPGPRSEVEIVAAIARDVLGRDGPIDWAALTRHREIREIIAAVVPGFEPLARIDAGGGEFHVNGRILHEPRFAMPAGRARFFASNLPRVERADDELLLTTIRSEGQFNTVVYEEEDVYRGQERRDVILMNAQDMRIRGIRPNQPVAVRSAAGVMRGILAREFDIHAGCAAMYYPEANVLVPRVADELSQTPAFKSVPVRVQADDGAALVPLKVTPVAASSDRRGMKAC
ncbi:MAG: FdhF/YdeP family oxidoreductase [Planctomycetia bacterium]|nr:MAG: FdhF/YdeP family oxidoreductase [Planctomycetia bacterium]